MLATVLHNIKCLKFYCNVNNFVYLLLIYIHVLLFVLNSNLLQRFSKCSVWSPRALQEKLRGSANQEYEQ